LSNVLRTENDCTPHLAADVVPARELKDHSLADRKDGTSKIARHQVFRPAIKSSVIHSNAPKNAKRLDLLCPGKGLEASSRRFRQGAEPTTGYRDACYRGNVIMRRHAGNASPLWP
jgi:hypothetical protein